jgi:titin
MNAAAAPVPDRPTNPAASGGNAKVTIEWTAPTDTGGLQITGYTVYKGVDPLSMDRYMELAPSPCTYQDMIVINGQTYFYSVSAHNANGEGPRSDTVSAKPLNVPSAPTAPSATASIGQMSVKWNPPYNEGGSPVSGYRIYRGTSASLLLFANDTDQTTFTDGGLSKGQTYYYQISAVNEVGEGPKCSVFQGTLASPPGPLLDVQAVASASKVTLTWTAPAFNGGSPITGYNIYRSVVPGQETILQTVTATTYQDLNLVNGVTYYYRISAANAIDQGQLSNEVPCTPAAVLGPPASIRAVPSNSNISLSWAAPENTGGSPVTSYKIYRGTSSAMLVLLRIVSETDYQDTGLTNGQAYFYKISSVNMVGEGSQSAAVSATPFYTPSAPLSLIATGGNGGVSLGWSAPFSNGGASILRYHVQWSNSAAGPWTIIDTFSTGTAYAHTGLTNGITYYYQVAAVNAAGEGQWTDIESATPHTVPSSPTISSVTGGKGNVTMVLTAPASDGGSPLTKYSLYRGTSIGTETLLRDVGLGLTIVDRAVSPGVTYYYRVTASSSIGESLKSNEASATTFGLPSAPASLTCTAGDRQVSLQWSIPSSDGGSPVQTYRLFFGTISGIYSGNVTVPSTSYMNGPLTNGIRYFYAVSAVNEVGQGSLSAECSAVPMTNPSAPQSLLATGGVRQVSLTWQPPLTNGGSEIDGYRLYRGRTVSSESLIATLGPEVRFTDTGLLDGTTYYYSVSAINEQGESWRSLDAAARTNAVPTAPTSLSIHAGDSQVQLSWSAPDDNGGSPIRSYDVYRSTVLGSYVLVAHTTSLGYSDLDLINGQRYYYAVSAVNLVGEGPRALLDSVMPAGIPSAPLQVVATPGVKNIIITWDAPTTDGGSSVLGYHVLRGNAPDSGTHVGDVNSNSYTDSPMSDGETYYYRVVAYNDVDVGPPSEEVSATSFSLPGIPTFLQAEVSDRSISLHWSEPVTDGGASIVYYSVYGGDQPDSMPLVTTISSRTYDLSGLINGHSYFFAVSATNAVGEGPSTDSLSAVPSRAPSMPLHFTSVAGIRQVTLSWSVPSDDGGASVNAYHLYRSLAVTGPYEHVVSLGATSYTDSQLNNGVKYYYHIAAVNAAGEGQYAATSSTTFPAPDPSRLNAEANGMDIHLTWSASTGATSYRLYRGDATGAETFLESVETNHHVDGPFVSGRSLYYFVTAVNATGESMPSNEVTATIVTSPSAPVNLTANVVGTKAVLRWEPSIDNGGSTHLTYQVLRGLSRGSEVAIGTCDSAKFNDSSIVSGHLYYYQVKAVNSAGTGPASNEVSLLYRNTFTAPILTATPGVEKVTLRWTIPAQTNGPSLIGYRVYRGSSSGSETFLIGVEVTEMTDTSVTLGQTYYYQVRGLTGVEEGPASNEANAKPFTYPGIPISFSATPAKASATMNWSAPISDGYSPIIGYHIFSGVSAGDLRLEATVSETRYQDVDVEAGVTYYYKVTAYNAAGDGNATGVVSVTIPAVIDPPIGLVATGSEGRITLVWNQPAGANVLTYSIFRGNDSGEAVYVTNYPGTRWVDNNVTAGQSYYYRVSATTTKGVSQMSEEAVATPKAAQSLSEESLFDQMWFRIAVIMGILVVGFFSFILFVKKGKVRVSRGK